MKKLFRYVSVFIIASLISGTTSFAEVTEGEMLSDVSEPPRYIFLDFCDGNASNEFVELLKDENEENGNITNVDSVSVRNTGNGNGISLISNGKVSSSISIKLDEDLSQYPYARVCLSYNLRTSYTGSFDALIKYEGASNASKLVTVESSGASKEVKNKDGESCGTRGTYRNTAYSFLSFVTGEMEIVEGCDTLIFSPADAGENGVNYDVIVKYIGLFKTAQDAEKFDPSVKSVTYTNGENVFEAEIDPFEHTAKLDLPDGEITSETASVDNLDIVFLDGRCTKSTIDVSNIFDMEYEIQTIEQKHLVNEYKKEIWTVEIKCTQIDDSYEGILVARLNALTLENCQDFIDDYDDGLGRLVSGYDELDDDQKTNLGLILTSYASNFTVENYVNTIASELFYAKVRACEAVEEFENIIKENELINSDTCKIFSNNLTVEEKDRAFTEAKKQLSYEGFCNDLIKQSLLSGVSMKEGYGVIKALFEDNLSVLGYDSDSYNTICLKTDNLTNAYKLLTLREFEDIESLKSAFEAAVESIGITEPDISSGSGGGSSGGGSSGGAGGGGPVNTNTKPPKTSEKKVEKEPEEEKESDDEENSSIKEEIEITKFEDLTGYDWAKESIQILYRKGVINGKSENEFAPGESITREEFVQMVVKAFNLTGYGEVVYDDVESDKWYYGAISAAVNTGIIKGISKNEFGVGKNIIRQDMAVIMANVLKVVGKLDEVKQEQEFDDESEISGYAKDAVSSLAAMGILKGSNGKFKPTRNMTRAEAAVAVAALMNLHEIE